MKTAIIAILMFCFLIFIHELGHFVAAKACDVKVNRFALGMGPKLIGKQIGETEYSLRAFPIGGYCEMEGENEDTEEPRAFAKKKAWQKSVILAAGPLMNVFMAFFLMVIVLFYIGVPSTTIGGLIDGAPAAEAGIELGDRLITVDGKEVKEWEDVTRILGETDKSEVAVVVERDGTEVTIVSEVADQNGKRILGIQSQRERNLISSIKSAPGETWELTKSMYRSLKQLVTGEISTRELTGPVGIVYVVNESAKNGLMNVLYLAALLSLNLAIINLLPFPALDGGRLVFVIIRKITGKAITDDMEAKVNFVGMMLLFALMIYVTWNDLIRLFGGFFGG